MIDLGVRVRVKSLSDDWWHWTGPSYQICQLCLLLQCPNYRHSSDAFERRFSKCYQTVLMFTRWSSYLLSPSRGRTSGEHWAAGAGGETVWPQHPPQHQTQLSGSERAQIIFTRTEKVVESDVGSSWAAAERLEQVFIQALSLATWSTLLGVYRVMSGVHTLGLTGAAPPHPGTAGPPAPMSGLMLV